MLPCNFSAIKINKFSSEILIIIIIILTGDASKHSNKNMRT
jgi:hypothetical protein